MLKENPVTGFLMNFHKTPCHILSIMLEYPSAANNCPPQKNINPKIPIKIQDV